MGIFIAYGVVAGIVICGVFFGFLTVMKSFFGQNTGVNVGWDSFNQNSSINSWHDDLENEVNAATGLQMVDGVDSRGNPSGWNYH